MRIRVSFSLYLPEGTSHEDIEQWLKFRLGIEGVMYGSNSLCRDDFQDIRPTDLNWEER